MTADQIRSLQPALAALLLRFRGCFKSEKTFGHWQRYLLGLMADLKRKSIEPIALAAGVAVRKVWVSLSESYPYHALFRRVYENLALSREGLVRVCPIPLRC